MLAGENRGERLHDAASLMMQVLCPCWEIPYLIANVVAFVGLCGSLVQTASWECSTFPQDAAQVACFNCLHCMLHCPHNHAKQHLQIWSL
jgi:hypothetical protein